MRQAGLWDQTKVSEVKTNLQTGVIEKEQELNGDTTHYRAYSSFETLTYEADNGKVNKKSQSKVTKGCRCEDWSSCDHPWDLRDEGAGTIVKLKTKMVWRHKASVIGLPKQGIALDAVAIADAATHDGQTFFPHVEQVLETYPVLTDWIQRVLYDSACHDAELKARFKDALDVELKASFNPRRSKPITNDLPRCIEKMFPIEVRRLGQDSPPASQLRLLSNLMSDAPPLPQRPGATATGSSLRRRRVGRSADRRW